MNHHTWKTYSEYLLTTKIGFWQPLIPNQMIILCVDKTHSLIVNDQSITYRNSHRTLETHIMIWFADSILSFAPDVSAGTPLMAERACAAFFSLQVIACPCFRWFSGHQITFPYTKKPDLILLQGVSFHCTKLLSQVKNVSLLNRVWL